MTLITDQFTLIGDIIGSRTVSDRAGLQHDIQAILDEENRRRRADASGSAGQDLETTVGDEFQGVYDSLADAVNASLVLRLALAERTGVDSRYGLGHGDIERFDNGQDGPGWWSARTAIDRAKRAATAKRTPFARTCFSAWSEAGQIPDETEMSTNAFLLMRDAAIAQMSDRERVLFTGFMRGESQASLAAREGITQSAVSQSLSRSGAFAIEAAQSRLRGDLE